MKIELDLDQATATRLKTLATQEETTASELVENLLNRHMRVINSAALDSDKYISFIHSLGEYMQEDLSSLSEIIESDEDRKMYHVFEALYAHTLENQILISDLYEVYKKA